MGVPQGGNKQQVLGKYLNTLWDQGLGSTEVVALILSGLAEPQSIVQELRSAECQPTYVLAECLQCLGCCP